MSDFFGWMQVPVYGIVDCLLVAELLSGSFLLLQLYLKDKILQYNFFEA